MSSRVARRYAKAVVALAREAGELRTVADELGRLATLAEEPTVAAVLRSPTLTLERRLALVETLVRELGCGTLVANLLRVLARQHRLGEIAGIRAHVQTLLDAELGRLRMTIRTARPLEPAQQEAIIAAFARRTGKEVIPAVTVDPDLLGGVQVEVAGTVFDGSVRTRLARLARELVGPTSL